MTRANSIPSPHPAHQPLEEGEEVDSGFSPRNTDFYRRISEVIADPKGLFHRREWSEEGFVGVKDPYLAAMELGREREREEEERRRVGAVGGDGWSGGSGSGGDGFGFGYGGGGGAGLSGRRGEEEEEEGEMMGVGRREVKRELRLEDLDFEFGGLGLEGGKR